MLTHTKKIAERELQKFVSRVVDVSSPNLPPPTGESRWEPRSNRTFPVVLAPWENDAPLYAESFTALTKNISCRGLAVVLHHPFRARRVVAGFWVHAQPHYVIGMVRQNTNLGGGFWQLGIELLQVGDMSEFPSLGSLTPFVARLVAN